VTFLLQQIINAAALVSIYALVALGVTLIFGLTGLVNFAHGEVMIVGGYVTFACVDAGLGFGTGLILATLASAALGAVLWAGLFRWTLERPIRGFIVSLGLIAVLQNALIWIFGTQPRITHSALDTTWTIAGARLSGDQLLTILVSAALLVGFFAFITHTRQGQALRACNDDRTMAGLMGIPAVAVIGATFAVGSALAGLAGGLLATQTPITPALGSLFIVKAFAVALIGGLGSPYGVLGGAAILGLLETVLPATIISPKWEPAIAFAVLAAVLIWRPHGLFRGAAGSAVA
jgi:branched-chain amino acid transport system permease protein